MTQSIPKIIHYCWFGRGNKPDIVKRCIDSWKCELVGYRIIEWNEDNFDINTNIFVREAYYRKKYAFVSDYVRVYALYKYGGIYMDTDVEVYKPFSEYILTNDSFWGFEEGNYIATSIIGCKKGNAVIAKFLDSYKSKSFINKEGKNDITTNVIIVNKIIKEMGIILNGKYQRIEGIMTIYPQEYFSPYDYINCYSKANNNTYTIHHFHKSWIPINTKLKIYIKRGLCKVIGGEKVAKIRKILIGKRENDEKSIDSFF